MRVSFALTAAARGEWKQARPPFAGTVSGDRLAPEPRAIEGVGPKHAAPLRRRPRGGRWGLRYKSLAPCRGDTSLSTGPSDLAGVVIGHSCICRRQGGRDAATEELVDGDPRPGAAGSARCDPVVARQHLHPDAREERAPPAQTSAWSWSAAGIEEQGGLTRARAFRCATSEPHCPRGARCGGPAARGPCDFGSAPPEPCGTHHGASRRWSPPEPLALPASQ
jgi:hypothetical protein